jgi:hypothetical protein
MPPALADLLSQAQLDRLFARIEGRRDEIAALTREPGEAVLSVP